jgi:hypothetical protein
MKPRPALALAVTLGGAWALGGARAAPAPPPVPHGRAASVRPQPAEPAAALAGQLGGRGAQVAGAAPASTGTRWSGYVVTARKVSFTRVTGTWIEPRVSCAPGTPAALSTVWVGLGGYGATSNVLDQVGTDANCDAGGRPRYFAWFELLPDVAHPLDLPVVPGDTMRGTVAVAETNLVEVRLEDLRRHWTFSRRIRAGLPDGSSAEWIVEAPYSCVRFACRQAPLADFGSVAIHGVAAVGNGRPGTLATPVWKRTLLRLTPCERGPSGRAVAAEPPATAIPRRVSRDGSAFAVAWAPARSGASCTDGRAGDLSDYTIG